MDGFKETELGLIPEDWGITSIGETCLIKNGYAFKSKDYVSNGILNFRVVNINSDGSIDIGSDTEYLPFSFAESYKKYLLEEGDILLVMVGATRGKLTYIRKNILPALMNQNMWRITPIMNKIDKKFLYFFLERKIDDFMSKYSENARGFFKKDEFKSVEIILLSLSEQQKIAHILSRTQDAIEKQQQIIKTTTELKKTLMQKLFTEGLLGEPQKETEIGLIPKSWDIRNINDFVLQTQTQNPKNEPKNKIKYIDVSSVSNQTFTVIGHQDCYREKAPGRARKVVYTNDVIFATIRPTLKRIAKIDAKYDDEYCSTAFCVLRPKKDLLDSEYLYQYLQTENFIDRISKLQSGASYPAVRDENVKSMVIPIPKIGEQSEIGNALKTIDQKIVFHRNRKQVLQSFFKSLLNQLMTGQIRVKDLEFDMEELEKRRH